MKKACIEMWNSLMMVVGLPTWIILWTIAGPFYGFRSWAWNIYHHKQAGEWVFVVPYIPKEQ